MTPRISKAPLRSTPAVRRMVPGAGACAGTRKTMVRPQPVPEESVTRPLTRTVWRLAMRMSNPRSCVPGPISTGAAAAASVVPG